MAKVSQMQGVPAHLEYLKMSDKKRHPARCIFANGKGKNRVCMSPMSPIYREHCCTARLCDCYEEQE